MNDLTNIAKILIITGIVFFLLGVIILAGSKLNLFNLPGDFSFEGKNWKVFFPIGTSILLSIILTAIFWIISKFFR